MERGSGSHQKSYGFIDRRQLLDVKPIRIVYPKFPNQSAASSPSQPAHYPFFVPNEPEGPTGDHAGISNSNTTIPTPVPLNSTPDHAGISNSNGTIPSPVPLNIFCPPSQNSNEDSGPSGKFIRRDQFGEGTSSVQKRKGRGRPRTTEKSGNKTASRKTEKSSGIVTASRNKERSAGSIAESVVNVEVDETADRFVRLFGLMSLKPAQQDDGNKDLVGRILMAYNWLRKRVIQIDDSKGDNPALTRRPDLMAGALLMSKGVRTNTRKRIGPVPGVKIGDIFFFRMEMCLAGLHSPSMAGIDYTVKVGDDGDPLAISIVSSGGYEDDGEEGDVLIYSGQGGVQRNDKQLFDQKLERGNLALEKSLHKGNEIRVIRGLKDAFTAAGKVYVYDGLYKVQGSWAEKGKGGCNVFKYKFVRIPGQREAFTLWKTIELWKDGVTSRPGLILPDLTSGAENIPVCLVNDMDNERGPDHFAYTPFLKYKKPFSSPSSRCSCHDGCQSGELNCPCVQKNEGFLPYTSLGVLLSYKTLVYECGPSCSCPLTCRNRVSQRGLKVRLEVFKTNNRGWGLRSWDPIRSGQFICVYGGEVIDKSKAIGLNRSDENDYIFDATQAYTSHEYVRPAEVPFRLVISAYNRGNVARFMNHSCTPNVFWQPVLREHNNESYVDIAFYAIGHIPPLQELTFDYGIIQTGMAKERKKVCLCGYSNCRGSFC